MTLGQMSSDVVSPLQSSIRPLWNELYDICWNFYVKNAWDSQAFKSIVGEIQRSKDKELIRFLIWFNDTRKVSTFNDKFQWITSFLYGRRYPPLDGTMLMKEPWNDLKNLESIIKYGDEPINLIKLTPPYQIEDQIVQNIRVNDCSLICSLINARKHNQIRSYTISGNFNVIFHFNGTTRLVTVSKDSRFPFCVNGGTALTLFSQNIEDMLVELAYLEVKNNREYAYEGSNTAMDTFLLTGWIPEIFNIRDVSLGEIRQYGQTHTMFALGTDSATGKEVTENHDFVVTSIDLEKNQFTVLNPHGGEFLATYSWDTLKKEFKWLYVNWDSTSKYSLHSKLHDRYSNMLNAYPTWTQKPLICIKNNSDIVQDCHLYLERHMLENEPKGSNLTLGEVPRIGFTAVTAGGNNSGFCNMKLRLQPREVRTLFYHSDCSCNLTFHLLSNSELINISKCKSNITTMESSWNITNNKWPIGVSEYLKSPVFKLQMSGSEDVYLDLELVSQYPAQVNFQVFESDDYALQRPFSKNITYSTQICAIHGIRLLQGRAYFVVCSVINHAVSPFILTLRNPFEQPHNISLTPYSLGFGGLRYNEVVVFKRRITISVSNFTRLFALLYTKGVKTSGQFVLRLFEKETGETLFEQTETDYDLSVKPLAIPHVELRSASYVLELLGTECGVTCNLGTSHRAVVNVDP